MHPRRLILLLFTLAAVLALAGWLPAPAGAQAGDPQSTPTAPDMPPMPPVDRLAPPPTVYPPTQAGEGAQVYYQVCMTCHGDLGQGLTEEWRMSLDPEDQNCWQSGCHHTRRPPQGFIFPREVPRVVGGGAMARFSTALDLYDFLVAEMPYQFPGSLSEEAYWQLTAFLLEKNGFSVPANLDTQSAAAFSLTAPPPEDPSAPLWLWITGGIAVVGLAAGAVVAIKRRLR